MDHPSVAAIHALTRAGEALTEAATELTVAMIAAGHDPLANDAKLLAQAIEAELAAVAAVLHRHIGDR